MGTNANFWRNWWDSRSRKISSDYELDRVNSLQNKKTKQIAENELLDFVDPKADDFIFDAGCGTGIDLSRLSSRAASIIGMDQSAGMIIRCKKRVIKENIFNSQLIVGSISEIGLKSNTFDKIICMSVLHYLNDLECESALKELVRISKDESTIVLHVKNLSSLYLSTLYIAKKIKRLFKKNVKNVYYRTNRWYEKRLSKLGAQIVDFTSSNIFLLDFFPKSLILKLQKIEIKYKGKFLRKYGAEYKIKAKIKKQKN